MFSRSMPSGIYLLVALALAAPALAGSPPARMEDGPSAATDESRLVEIPMRVKFLPGPSPVMPGGGGGAGSPLAGDCPPVESTLNTAHDFDDPEPTVYVQAGMGEGEMAAATYQLTPDDFPLILDEAWILFGTAGTAVTTTTHWSFLVWEGDPANGNLVTEWESDDIILPHLVIPPGNNGVYISLLGDPEDPIVLQNNGSAKITIAFRIDQHHNQTQNPCLVAPPTGSNAFPTTDTNGLQFGNANWLFGVNCGPLGCPANGGWGTFSSMFSWCTPSGDWIMRAIWHSTPCSSLAGACCLTDGSCDTIEEADCLGQGGDYQGDGVACFQVTCPDPVGACCVDSSCTPGIPENDCLGGGGTWLGPKTDCTGDPCAPGVGACCIPATGGCLDLDGATCDTAGGLFQGEGTACASIVCFPLGACCLLDGSCLDDGGAGMSPEDCAAAGGTFQGDGTDCGSTNCPLPEGACCLTNGNCLVFNEADCATAGGAWAGMQTDCEDADLNGTADACEADCPTDLDDDGETGFSDLLIVLSSWGPCVDCPADLDDSGDVGFSDLLAVLSNWGPCE